MAKYNSQAGKIIMGYILFDGIAITSDINQECFKTKIDIAMYAKLDSKNVWKSIMQERFLKILHYNSEYTQGRLKSSVTLWYISSLKT